MSGSVVVEEIKQRRKGTGFDCVEKSYTDMEQAGIMDAAKAARLALERAASLAAVLLTTQASVCDRQEERKESTDFDDTF